MVESAQEYAEKFPGLSWFGQSWGSEANRLFEQVAVPVGQRCTDCTAIFRARDRGFQVPKSAGGFLYYHLFCWAGGTLGLSPGRT